MPPFFFIPSDIDECASGVQDCHRFASCRNTDGSYSCSCNHPSTGNGKTCSHPVAPGKYLEHIASLEAYFKSP